MAAYFFGGGPGWRAGGSLPGTDRRPVVTYTLLAINVAVWLAMELAGGSEDRDVLLRFGAMFGPLIAGGEYWRLFTAMFLHVGILHLASNSFTLLIFGRMLEGIYGPVRFALIYLVAGLFGSVASYLLNPISTSAGASGAILGVLGALVAFFLARRETLGEMGRQTLTGLAVIAAFILLFGFTQPGLDNWAHVGGLAAGFAIGMALAPNYRLVDDTFGFGGRMVDVNSLARSFWVVPLALVILAGATALGNSRTPNVESHFERAERFLREGHRQASFNELMQALDIATLTGDYEAIASVSVRIDSLNR